MDIKYKYLVIEGNIGAGKTSLTKMIANQFNAKLVLEQFADNPFLPKFYENQERYSFPLEMSFLADRYNQLKSNLSNQDLFKSFTIADYYFMKSLIFAKNTLQDDEYHLYSTIFNIIYQTLPKPDLYVYLHVSVPALLENIKQRGRDYEKTIKASYLQKIQDGYFEFFKQQSQFKVLILDTGNLDFVNNKNDYNTILNHIFNTKIEKTITRITL